MINSVRIIFMQGMKRQDVAHRLMYHVVELTSSMSAFFFQRIDEMS